MNAKAFGVYRACKAQGCSFRVEAVGCKACVDPQSSSFLGLVWIWGYNSYWNYHRGTTLEGLGRASWGALNLKPVSDFCALFVD